MKQHMIGSENPTANIAVNKSRVKLYKKDGEIPTYYLQKGQEFQIELFNPTTDTILAKITLNNKIISQGGLVLRPGQRVFLERFLDVEKKFLFDTYEVSNTEEVKKAIKYNGDFKVEFFREDKTMYLLGSSSTVIGGSFGPWWGTTSNGTLVTSSTATSTNGAPYTLTSTLANNTSFYNSSAISNDTLSVKNQNLEKSYKTRSLRSAKSIETGIVEQGSKSDQKFNTINKKFEHYAFHSIEAKLLPISQKLVSSEELHVKKYCTNCGAKLGKTDKFCSQCGNKA